MFKKKKKAEATLKATPEATTPAKSLPPLPVRDSMAAGVIAVAFAVVGMMMAVKVCKAANPKKKKPQKPKKPKKAKK